MNGGELDSVRREPGRHLRQKYKKSWNNSNKITLKIFRRKKPNLRRVTSLEVTWTRRTVLVSLQLPQGCERAG
jgi:hypothetical protein